jgi:Outer membrane protein Omp28
MRLTFSILAIALSATIFSCSKNSDTGTTPIVTPPAAQLTVSFSNSQIAADGFDETTIMVKDQNNADVTASTTIYINNVAATSTKFFTASPGNYQIKAVKGTVESPVVTLAAVTPGPALFTQKVLAEFFTGTWCGICPGTLIPFYNYTNANPNCISVGVHGPNGSGDPYTYQYDAQLRSAFSVGGVPTVLLNRASNWNNNTAALDALAATRAPLGIALETSISGSTISVKAKVKFDVSTSIPLKLVVMLVEDNLISNQSNYGHFGLPNPIVGFNHRNVLRSAATDIFGDAIPVALQVKGTTWEKTLTVNASGYNLANCKIIGTVVFDTNSQNRKGTLNTQIVNAGQVKNFD